MGVNTDGEEMDPGSTVTDEVKLTENACEFVRQHEYEQSLPQDADCDVGIQGQKPVDGLRIPLISPLQSMPSQHTSVVSNTEQNAAQMQHKERTDGGSSVPSNTPSPLQPDHDTALEDRHPELPHGDPVFLDTDTFTDDTCIPMEERTFHLQPAEIMGILETETNDDWDAMYDTLLDEISPSDASAFKLELPFNPDIDQVDKKGYTPLYNASLEGHLEGVDDLISRGANPNKPSKGGLRPLHAAVLEGHTRIVDFLILQGAEVNIECERGTRPLHTAAAKGYIDILESLVAEETNVNMEDHTGWTPFNTAVQEGHLEAAKYLMTEGAKQNRYAGMTPLYAAAHFGHLDIVKFLISNGADVNEEHDKGMIPLYGAAIRGHLKVMEYLIQHGSDLNNGDAKGGTPFNAAVQYGHLEAVKYLITEGAKQNRYDGMTPLYNAAQYGHLDIVKLFISLGDDVNEENDNAVIPLHGAASGGHLEVMEHLIQQGSDVNKADAGGWTPFNAAVQYGYLETVKYLMSEGAKQNRYDGLTPLYAAARFGHLDIVKFFISNGADVNEEDDEGMIPLHGAACGGHLKVMEYLIQQGSEMNKKDKSGWIPFNAAVQYGHLPAVKYLWNTEAKESVYNGITPIYSAARFGHKDVVKFLVSKGGNLKERDNIGQTPLHAAAMKGDIEILQYLIQEGCDVNKKDNTGMTPLIAAVQTGHLEAIKYLLTEGAEQNRYDGMTPLDIAAQLGHGDLVQFFISKEVDVNEENDKGRIPLHGAAIHGNNELMKYLIQQDSDVNNKNYRGRTPLHAAISNGHLEVVKVLLAKGAQGTGFQGLTPLYIATQYDHINVVKFLVSNGYDVNEKKECGKSSLHAGCYNGNMDIVKLLVHNNANVNEQDHDGWTPLEAAAQKGHQDIVDYLALNGADMHVRDKGGLTPLQAAANAGNLNSIKGISLDRCDPVTKETGDPRFVGHQSLVGGGHVTVTRKNAGTQSCIGQLASQVDNADETNDCNQPDIANRAAGELSLKNIQTKTHGDEKGASEEQNHFIHAKLKYPDVGKQDQMLDQIEAMKSPMTTNGTDSSSPRGSQTCQYSGFDPPSLQTMETDGHLYEELDSRCYSLINENRPMREPSSSMNAGNDLAINGTSTVLESFPTHPPDVVHQKLHDRNPVSSQGTSANPGWKIRTKLRTSVYRCPSILALVQIFLQMSIALAIILAGSPVLVAGSGIPERVTLQAGKAGVVPFYFHWPPNITSQGISFFTLRFESKRRPFYINGGTDIKGFKSPSQLPRYTTSVKDLDYSVCVNLIIDNVNTLDEDGYVLTAVWLDFHDVWNVTIKKEIVVQVPPEPAKCFITLSDNRICPYEVHCRANSGSVRTTLSCFQNDRKIDVKGEITDNGLIARGMFWLPHITYFSCCSHDVTLYVSDAMCNDFEWPPIIQTTKETGNTVSELVTTPTPQIESQIESGACRQFKLLSLWHFTYLLIYLLHVVTM